MIKSNKQASELCSEAEDAAYQATCHHVAGRGSCANNAGGVHGLNL